MFGGVPSKAIKTPIAEVIYYPSKNYLHVVSTANKTTTKNDVIEHLHQLIDLVGDVSPPLFLADIRSAKNVSKEVRDTLSNHPLAVRLASKVAVLVNSSLSQILGNLFIRFSKPPYPTKIFSQEEKAAKWLLNNR